MILTFQHPQLISEYYETSHAVDDNNNLRQGSLSVEDGLAVRPWHIRQFFALMAISEVNALCFYTHNRALQGGGNNASPLSMVKFPPSTRSTIDQ